MVNNVKITKYPQKCGDTAIFIQYSYTQRQKQKIYSNHF